MACTHVSRPPALQRSPSFTGAVDVEKMLQQSRSSKPDVKHVGQVQLTDNLSHLMWNGAQRQKAWVDGKKESQGMRIQRSISFDSAVKIMQSIQEEEERTKKEGEQLWDKEQARLYSMPVFYQSSSGRRKGMVRVTVTKEKQVRVVVRPEAGDAGPGPLLFHWGVGANDPFEWTLPDRGTLDGLGSGTNVHGDAAQTPMTAASGNEQVLEFSFAGKAPKGLTFVLKDTRSSAWYKHGDKNFCVAVSEEGREELARKGGGGSIKSGIVRTLSGTDIHPPKGAELAKEIFDAEGKSSVTLMHRYNHAASLIERTPPGPASRDAIAMIFVWLRFSQIRQLSWQRNYNTKPRELSAASDNLNKLISWRWKNSAVAEKELYRLMLGCIGRGGSGGDGQAIRDEILHIMHRHKIPESKGNWVEEWHQKLHNNSTPDDIVICQAYLAYLASNGNMNEYLRVLRENGLSPEALRKYERPIVTDPVFYGDKKDGLIHDFNNYLRILKNVHAGADLEKCVEVCSGFLDGHINVLLDSILRERGASDRRVLAVIDSITEVRQLIGNKLVNEGDIHRVRDMLYLDLGLEAQMRLMAERTLGSLESLPAHDKARTLALWVSLAAENLIYSSCPGVGRVVDSSDPSASANELKACVRDWAQLLEDSHKGLAQGWPVKAMPVVERMRRALGEIVEHITGNMQQKAEYLGYGLAAVTPEKIPEKWSITLFSEELIRGGGCSFVLSSLLRKLDKVIRELGGGTRWQIISHGEPGAVGELVECEDLMSVQSKVFDRCGCSPLPCRAQVQCALLVCVCTDVCHHTVSKSKTHCETRPRLTHGDSLFSLGAGRPFFWPTPSVARRRSLLASRASSPRTLRMFLLTSQFALVTSRCHDYMHTCTACTHTCALA
jgi:alpha-glucan,water dikinase